MVAGRKNWLAFGVVGLAVILSGSVVQAQGQNQPPGGGRGGQFFGGFGGGAGGELMLLMRPDIQDALEMVDDQKEKVRTAMEDYQGKMREMFTGMRDLSAEERTAKFQDLQKKMNDMAEDVKAKILLPQQKDRLKQLAFRQRLQGGGFGGGQTSVPNSDVLADALKLTDDQKEKLKAKAEELDKKLKERMAKVRKEAEEELLGVLTKEQLSELQSLMGDPYDFSTTRGFGGFGGGRGGAGGAGGRPGTAGRPGT